MTAKHKDKAAAKAVSLHIGLNAVDGAAYGGWDGPLAACEFDANDMAAIARGRGMTPSVLLTRHATRAAVLSGLRHAAHALTAGDLFFLSYSGHGGQVPDINGDDADGKDETWCLWDGQLIDDELYLELSQFAAGVRILVLSDSCHSGTVTRERPPVLPPGVRERRMPDAVARRVYEEHKSFYDKLQQAAARSARELKAAADPDAALAQVAHTGAAAAATELVGPFKPSVLLISGCQDNQTSLDGDHNGAFTEQLLKIWNHGKFKGSYSQFHAHIKAGMPSSQTPNLFTLGPAAAFAAQEPFAV